MLIKNRNELATTKIRKQVLDIIEASITRVLPPNTMKSAVSYDTAAGKVIVKDDSYLLSKGRIFIIGGGKPSGLMAETLETIIGPEHIFAGVVNCTSANYGTQKIKIVSAGHPIPDQRGVNGVKEMLALKQHYSITENDLVICLISGGGSALMPCPVDVVNLKDKQNITDLLLSCGAEIGEINTVRKHLSQIKGGQLGQYYAPATVISLILSDVIGNDLATIASGPTFPDYTTFQDAYAILQKYDLVTKAPKSVIAFINQGCRGEVPETPKTLSNCHNYIIGDMMLALEAALHKAREIGLMTGIITAGQKGETTAVAQFRAEEILNARYAEYNTIIIGGETTPKLPADAGRGGRNQQYAAVSMQAMKVYNGEWVMASVGTDGSDFLPDVAGAIVDQNSLKVIENKKIYVTSYLDRYDSYTLLDRIGNSLIVTGNTGTNVGDIVIYLLK